MKIAIVGTSTISNNQERVRQSITSVLIQYNNQTDQIISGGAQGIDALAIEVAEILGFKTATYEPHKQEWEYFKQRNIRIAEECDVIYCFTIPTKTKKCYHHDTLQDHEKTAGCWTLKKAKEMNKKTKLVII